MASKKSAVPTPVTVIREVGHRIGFRIPSCRGDAETRLHQNEAEDTLEPKEEESRFVFHRKKRDLSPAFQKILKVLEERTDHASVAVSRKGNVDDMDGNEETDVVGLSEVGRGTELKSCPSPLQKSHGGTGGGGSNSRFEKFEDTLKNQRNEIPTTDNAKKPESDCDMEMTDSDDDDFGRQSELKNIPNSTSFSGHTIARKTNVKEVEVVKMKSENRAFEQSRSQAFQASQSELQRQNTDGTSTRYYNACFAKASMRKHKRFEEDGYIIITTSGIKTKIVLKDSSRETIESSNNYKVTSEMLEDGKIFTLGGKEIQIGEPLEKHEFEACMPDCKMEVEDHVDDEKNSHSHSSNNSRQLGPGNAEERFIPDFNCFQKPSLKQERIERVLSERGGSQASQSATQSQNNCDTRYYEVVFAKASMRKHKRFEDDGYLVITSGTKTKLTLKDTSGEIIESSNNYKITTEILEDGKVFQLGGKELQIVGQLDVNPFTVKVNNADPIEVSEAAEFKSNNPSKKPIDVRDSSSRFNNGAFSICKKELGEVYGVSDVQRYSRSHAVEVQAPSRPVPVSVPEAPDDFEKKYYSAVYAKASTRKHKRFDNDGYIVLSSETSIALKNTSGKTIESNSNFKISSEILEDGLVFKLGGKEIQIVEQLKSDPFPDYGTPEYGPLGILGRNQSLYPVPQSNSCGTSNFEIVKPSLFESKSDDDTGDSEAMQLQPPKKKMKSFSIVEESLNGEQHSIVNHPKHFVPKLDQLGQDDGQFFREPSPFFDSDEELF